MMDLDHRKPSPGPADAYRAAIDIVASWDLLADLVERISEDPRLDAVDRETLLAVVNAREPRIRPDWVQPPNG